MIRFSQGRIFLAVSSPQDFWFDSFIGFLDNIKENTNSNGFSRTTIAFVGVNKDMGSSDLDEKSWIRLLLTKQKIFIIKRMFDVI